MVHNSNDANRSMPASPETSPDSGQKEHGILQPEFTVDDDGIPYCKTQTDYEKIKSMNLKERFPQEFEKILTCLRCEHYRYNDCFFPKNEINKIEQDRQDNRIKCALCGMKIHRMFSVMMSLYYKTHFGVHIPVMCCTCYASLENGSYIKNSKRRMILFAISLITSIYFLATYFLTVLLFNYVGILIFLIPFSFWGYISIRDAKNLYYLYKGRKYYESLMGAEQKEVEKSRRDQMQDEDDRRPPNNGAFNAPGYEEE